MMSSTTRTFFPSNAARSPPVICTLPTELRPLYDLTLMKSNVKGTYNCTGKAKEAVVAAVVGAIGMALSGTPPGSHGRGSSSWQQWCEQIDPFVSSYLRPGRRGWSLPKAARGRRRCAASGEERDTFGDSESERSRQASTDLDRPRQISTERESTSQV